MAANPLPDYNKVIIYGPDGNPISATNKLEVSASFDTSALATAAKQDTQTTALGTLLTQSDFDTKAGALTEVAPASDTASSGLNGRLQRIAQRLTTFLGIGANAPQFQGATVALSGSAAALNADIIAAVDVSAYRQLAIQVGGFGSATVQVQFSLDSGTTWVLGIGTNLATLAISTAGITAAGIYVFPIPPQAQLRVRITTYSSGTITGNVGLSSIPFTPSAIAGLFTSSGASPAISGPTDSFSNATSTLAVNATNLVYDGNTSWNRFRGQAKETVLASAARTATTSANLTLYNNCAILLVVDVTARAAATTLTPSLVMGQTGFIANKTIWTAAAAINTASGTTMYVLWPMPTIASPTGYAEVVNVPLFRELQVTITPNDANSVTYSVVAYTALLG